MKKLLILVPVVLLAACSSTSVPKVTPVQELKEMSRTDVISAARDCVNGRMKPSIQSVAQKTDHGTILIPVAVNCDVYGPTYPKE